MKIVICLFLFWVTPGFAEFGKTSYPFSNEPIDVVIPCVGKDKVTLELCIAGIRKNGENIRRIIVVSKEPLTVFAEWFDEQKYPFSKNEIALELFRGDADAAQTFVETRPTRIGWIYQQFLKLYAPYVIPGISSNVLVLDSDVIFLNPVNFMTKKGAPFFNSSSEYYVPYFEHAARLLPDLHRVHPKHSGICHFMLFQKPILDDLFERIRLEHGIEPWRAMCRCVDEKMVSLACLSEYEIYFNFAQLRSNQCILRPLKWIELARWEEKELYRKENYVYLACHEWIRTYKPDRIKKYHHKRRSLPKKRLAFFGAFGTAFAILASLRVIQRLSKNEIRR